MMAKNPNYGSLLPRQHTNEQSDDSGSPFKARRAGILVAPGVNPGLDCRSNQRHTFRPPLKHQHSCATDTNPELDTNTVRTCPDPTMSSFFKVAASHFARKKGCISIMKVTRPLISSERILYHYSPHSFCDRIAPL